MVQTYHIPSMMIDTFWLRTLSSRRVATFGIMGLTGVVYVLARLYIVVESLISLWYVIFGASVFIRWSVLRAKIWILIQTIRLSSNLVHQPRDFP